MSEETTNPAASVEDDGTIKLNLDALQEQSTDEVPVRDEPAVSEEVREQDAEEPVQEPTGEEPAEVEQPVQEEVEQPVLREITDEEVEEVTEELQEEVEEAIAEAAETGVELPENIQKVVDFINETGGSLEDYVRLNTDYASLNEDQLLREFYESKYTSYDREDIDFLMNDKFGYEEDVDDEIDIRRKKLARKEALAEAKKPFRRFKKQVLRRN